MEMCYERAMRTGLKSNVLCSKWQEKDGPRRNWRNVVKKDKRIVGLRRKDAKDREKWRRIFGTQPTPAAAGKTAVK